MIQIQIQTSWILRTSYMNLDNLVTLLSLLRVHLKTNPKDSPGSTSLRVTNHLGRQDPAIFSLGDGDHGGAPNLCWNSDRCDRCCCHDFSLPVNPVNDSLIVWQKMDVWPVSLTFCLLCCYSIQNPEDPQHAFQSTTSRAWRVKGVETDGYFLEGL